MQMFADILGKLWRYHVGSAGALCALLLATNYSLAASAVLAGKNAVTEPSVTRPSLDDTDTVAASADSPPQVDATSSDSFAYAGTASHAFGTVDLETGVFTQLGDTGLLLAGMGVAGGKLFATGYQTSSLYTVNITNGKLTAVGNASITYSEFGSTTTGGLYGLDADANVYSINSSTGAATLLGASGLVFSGDWGLSSNSPTLYQANGTNLYTLDTHTGAATLVGSLGSSTRLGGLILEDGVLWGGEEAPSIAVAKVNSTTGAATTGAAFTGTGSGIWWAMAPYPIPPVETSTSIKASTSSAAYGTAVSLTSLVTAAAGTSTPTGSVAFEDGSTILATVVLNGAGQAGYTTSTLAVGSHSLSAHYKGSVGDEASASSVITVSITGTPVVKLSASSVAFGNQTVGAASPVKTITVTNTGSATLSLSSIVLTGGQADDFALTKTCGSTLAAGASCSISLSFKPVSTGSKSASVTITDNATGSPQKVTLSGTGTAAGAAPVVNLSATSLAFGNETVESSSVAKSVTVTNSGTGTLSLSSVAIVGGEVDDFALTKTCGSTLAPSASCKISVTFTPVSTGNKTATVSIKDNATGSPQTIALSGTGIAAASTGSKQ